MTNYNELKEKLISLLPGYKPNPNGYVIINKWNWRIYKKHQMEVFDTLEDVFEEMLSQEISKSYDMLGNTKDIAEGYGTFVDFNTVANTSSSYRPNKYSETYLKPKE